MKVKPTGPHDADLMLIGEAPGADEDRAGVPFVGAAGKMLNFSLKSAGIKREECFITNVVDQRPPDNDFSWFLKKKPDYVRDQKQDLWRTIDRVKPKVIVPMGMFALEAITGQTKIFEFRGCPQKAFNALVVPVVHPAYYLRVYHEKIVLDNDFKKIKKYLDHGWEPPKMRHRPWPSYEEIIQFLENCPPLVTVDIETIGTQIRMIGFGWSDEDAICIPLMQRNSEGFESRWPEEIEVDILTRLQKVLGSGDVQKVLQNFPFDTTMMERNLGIETKNVVLDTYAHQLLYPELPKGLKFMISLYTDYHAYWQYEMADDYSTAVYNCFDCTGTFSIYKIVREGLEERNMLSFYNKRTLPAQYAVTRMENRGVKVSIEAREKIKLETEQAAEETREELEALIGRKLNPNSPKQVAEYLYGELRLPKQRNKKTGNPSTGELELKFLKKQASPFTRQVIDLILEYRQKTTLLGNFADTKLDPQGRIRTSYSVHGTVTGRLSSRSTFEGYGGNLQNIPRGPFRRVFVPDDGYVFIKADLRQAEFMCFAWFAGVRKIIDKYLHDPFYDIHTWNASENIYNVPMSEVTKTQRSNAKNGVYAANYKVGAMKISRMYDIPFQEAKFIIEQYKRSIPELESWWAEIESILKRSRTLVNPFGRERIFLGRLDDNTLREALSWTCQSTVADIINEAIVELDKEEPELLYPALQIHDELVVQANKDRLDEAAHKVKNAMEIPLHISGVKEPLLIPTELNVGPNWYDVEEYSVGQLSS